VANPSVFGRAAPGLERRRRTFKDAVSSFDGSKVDVLAITSTCCTRSNCSRFTRTGVPLSPKQTKKSGLGTSGS
jgi:hypothetical protein